MTDVGRLTERAHQRESRIVRPTGPVVVPLVCPHLELTEVELRRQRLKMMATFSITFECPCCLRAVSGPESGLCSECSGSPSQPHADALLRRADGANSVYVGVRDYGKAI